MVSLRFPFSSFPHPPHHRHRKFSLKTTAFIFSAAAATGATVFAGISSLHSNKNKRNPQHSFLQNALNFIFSSNPNAFSSPLWGSLSLSENSPPVVESRTGFTFPSVIDGSKQLLGVGLRRKSLLGLKEIDVYVFGVYADDHDVKKLLNEKYGKLSSSDLKDCKEVAEDLMKSDICMTVRLQIVYGKLSIKSVRNAFEESVGSRLQKFGEGDNKELLQRFTSQFKDEYKIPRGTIIDLSRNRDYVLDTTIDGKEVGSIQSKVLCQSILDLYLGEDPFDRKAKEDVQQNLGSLLQK